MIYWGVAVFMACWIGMMLFVWFGFWPLVRLVSCKRGHDRWWFACDICKGTRHLK